MGGGGGEVVEGEVGPGEGQVAKGGGQELLAPGQGRAHPPQHLVGMAEIQQQVAVLVAPQGGQQRERRL